MSQRLKLPVRGGINMLMSRHMTSQIDVAMVHAFVHHQFPQLAFQPEEWPDSHHQNDGFADNQQLDQFAAELKKRTGCNYE